MTIVGWKQSSSVVFLDGHPENLRSAGCPLDASRPECITAEDPSTCLDDETVAQARAALDLDLPPAALRRLRDQVDELERRRAVIVAFPI